MRDGRLIRQEVGQPWRVAARLPAGARVPGSQGGWPTRPGHSGQSSINSCEFKTNDWRIRQCLYCMRAFGQHSVSPTQICFPQRCGMSWLMTSSLTWKLRYFATYWTGRGVNLKAHKRNVLYALVSKGLVGPAKDDPERFQLTDKAHHLLAERGVGISGG